MAGIVVDFDGEITAHRLIRDDVLNALYASKADNIRKLLDTGINLICASSKISGLESLPNLMGLFAGETHKTQARTRLEAIRHAVILYSSLCTLDNVSDASDDEQEIILVEDVNKNFAAKIREKTISSRPDFTGLFNRMTPVSDNGVPVKFGFLSDNAIVHFSVLSPIYQSESVRKARAKLWELQCAREYSSIENAALIMGVPREDDATIGSNQLDSAKRNRDEIEREADKWSLRLFHVTSPELGSERLKDIAA